MSRAEVKAAEGDTADHGKQTVPGKSEDTDKTLEQEEKSEKTKEKKMAYIYTYIQSINQSINNPSQDHNIHALIVVPQSVHEAAKLLAPLFHTTISNLYVEGLLKHLQDLAPQLPKNMQLNLLQQNPVSRCQQPDSMLDLEVERTKDQLRPHVEKLKRIKPTREWHDPGKSRFNRDQIEKLLPKAIRIVRRSKDTSLEQLVFEAHELLRNWTQEMEKPKATRS